MHATQRETGVRKLLILRPYPQARTYRVVAHRQGGAEFSGRDFPGLRSTTEDHALTREPSFLVPAMPGGSRIDEVVPILLPGLDFSASISNRSLGSSGNGRKAKRSGVRNSRSGFGRPRRGPPGWRPAPSGNCGRGWLSCGCGSLCGRRAGTRSSPSRRPRGWRRSYSPDPGA